MSRFLRCSLLTILLASAQLAWGDDSKKDEDRLQGTWQAIDGMSEGQPVPRDQLERMKFAFSGEKMTVFPPNDKDGSRAVEYTFRVDASRKPKTIDATRSRGGSKGKMVLGIYELDGDTLRMCFPNRLEKDRPKEFAAPEKSGLTLLTLKRVKK